MRKYLSILFFCFSANCLANPPVNCSNINDNTQKSVANILHYMCDSSSLNKMNYITENTTALNQWIANGYFFIINTAENALLIPQQAFKKMLRTSYIDSESMELVYKSSAVPSSEVTWFPERLNTSILAKTPVHALNKFIGINNYYNDRYVQFDATKVGIAIAITFVTFGVCVLIWACIVKNDDTSEKNRAVKRMHILDKENSEDNENYFSNDNKSNVFRLSE